MASAAAWGKGHVRKAVILPLILGLFLCPECLHDGNGFVAALGAGIDGRQVTVGDRPLGVLFDGGLELGDRRVVLLAREVELAQKVVRDDIVALQLQCLTCVERRAGQVTSFEQRTRQVSM